MCIRDSSTSVVAGDRLGGIFFTGADGTDIESLAAVIQAKVDGTPGTNDMPGRLEFYTTPDGSEVAAERMRIDSSGDILFGGITDKNVFNNTSGTGTSISNTAGEVQIANNNDTCLYLNRMGGSGTLVSLRQAGTNYGTIGVYGGAPYIGHASGGFMFNGAAIEPTQGVNRINDTVDLGSANYRFKDIYAGGGILLSGTGASNRLENFQDITQCGLGNNGGGIQLYKGSTLVSSSYNARYGYYSRVGNMVWFSFYFYVNSGGATASGPYRIYGFPFNWAHLTNAAYQSIQTNYLTINGTNVFNTNPHRWQANSTTYLELYGNNASQNWTASIIEFAGSGVLYIT